MSRSTSQSSTFRPPPAFGGTDKLTRLAWGTLLVLCGALFLDALDVSMMGVALPSIRTSLHMSTSSLQWVVSAYVLGYGGFLLLGGRAADLLGRRRVFLIALAVFIVASRPGRVRARRDAADRDPLHQGRQRRVHRARSSVDHHHDLRRGAGTQQGAVDLHRDRRDRVLARAGRSAGLLTEIGWRWVFFLPAPVALVTLVAGLRLVPRDVAARRASGSFDLSGAVSMTAAMLVLVFTLVEAPTAGWLSARTLGSLAASSLLFAAFVARERTRGRAARAARHPPFGLARAGEPRRDVAVRRLGRLPVHRHALSPAAPRLVGARHRARDLSGGRARGGGFATDGLADRAVRRLPSDRRRDDLGRGRLCALPADRAPLELRVRHAADVPAGRASVSRWRSAR